MFFMLPFIFIFFADILGQDAGETSHVVKYANLSFKASGICINLMTNFPIQNLKHIYHIFYWDFNVWV